MGLHHGPSLYCDSDKDSLLGSGNCKIVVPFLNFFIFGMSKCGPFLYPYVFFPSAFPSAHEKEKVIQPSGMCV